MINHTPTMQSHQSSNTSIAQQQAVVFLKEALTCYSTQSLLFSEAVVEG